MVQQTAAIIKFTCIGCGKKVGEEETINNLTQKILEICNECTERPFSEYIVQPYTNQTNKGRVQHFDPP